MINRRQFWVDDKSTWPRPPSSPRVPLFAIRAQSGAPPSTALLTALNFGKPAVANFFSKYRVARENLDHVSPTTSFRAGNLSSVC